MEPRHLEELRTRGYTVIRGLVGADQCAAARAAIDAALGGPGPTEAVDTQLAAGLGENSGSANHIHAIAHPHPAMAVMAPSMPAVAEVHAAALRSDRQHLCLNGQSLLRSDPTDDPTAHERGVVGSGWHLDNAFLASHGESTPRQVYTRSMVTLSDVESGGAAMMFSPGSVEATRREVQRLVDERGEAEYHGQNWRIEVVAQLTSDAGPDHLAFGAGVAAKGWHGEGLNEEKLSPAVEVLTGQGDCILFEAMSFHSASRCLNGRPRYAWVSACFDHRAIDLPHKLYQTQWAPGFVDALPAESRPLCDWLGPFVRDHLSSVEEYAETQGWVYAARRGKAAESGRPRL